MGKKRYIDTKFWSDPWVVDVLDPLTCHLFMYLLTNEHTTIAGVYEISLRTIAFEVKIEQAEVERMLERLKPKVYYVDGFLILRNGIRNQNYKNEKIHKAILNTLENVPAEIIEHISFPHDFDEMKPKGSQQTKLIEDDIDALFSTEIADKKTTVDKKPVIRKTSSQGVKRLMHEQSHSNVNYNTNSNTVVRTAGTTGSKDLDGRKYSDVTMLFDDLKAQGIVNEQFKAWYCSVFFKLGRDRVLVLASQARADGTDPQKLFSHLLQKESGIKQTTGATK